MTGPERHVRWLDFLPSPVQCMTLTHRFAAVNMRDGGVNVYSPVGRRFVITVKFTRDNLGLMHRARLMPTIMLPAPCSLFASQSAFLVALTCTGQIYMWCVSI